MGMFRIWAGKRRVEKWEEDEGWREWVWGEGVDVDVDVFVSSFAGKTSLTLEKM